MSLRRRPDYENLQALYRRLSNLRRASVSSHLVVTEGLINRVIRRLDNLRYIF
jgi:hypothetical protein